MFAVHDTFASHEEFMAKLEEFQIQTNTQFVTKKSTIMHITNPYYANFKYLKKVIACKYGFKKCSYKPKKPVNKPRPKQNSRKLGCPVEIELRFRKPKDGKAACLQIWKMVLEHENHVPSKEVCLLLP